MDVFAERVRRSDAVSFVSLVFYRGNQPVVVTDEFVASFKPEVTRSQIDARNLSHGVTILERLPFAPNTFLLRVNRPGLRGSIDAANAYVESGLVRFAQPNFWKVQEKRSQFKPTDPLFAKQWHLTRVQAEAAWDITRGKPEVLIAVVDTGIEPRTKTWLGPARLSPPVTCWPMTTVPILNQANLMELPSRVWLPPTSTMSA